MRPPLGSWIGPSRTFAPSFSSRRMSASMSVESKPKCSRPKWAEAFPGWSVSPVRGPEMFTAMPPSTLWQRMKRSPNTRVSSLTILKSNAPTYHSAVRRGSEAFRWMWLIRYAMTSPQGFLRRRGRCSPSMTSWRSWLRMVTPVTSTPVVRPGSTAVMVSMRYRVSPTWTGLRNGEDNPRKAARASPPPSLDLPDLDDQVAVGQLPDGQTHPVSAAEPRAIEQVLRLGIEGHPAHLVHEPGRRVVIDEHQGIAGPCRVGPGDAIEPAAWIGITPGAPDAGGEAQGKESEEGGDGPAASARHQRDMDRLPLMRGARLRRSV